MKIYLDTCIYCRPFDDQSQDRIEKETKALEDLMSEGARALIDRLGYANAARFIAILGGEGDSVADIREKRTKSDIDEITERIKRLRSDQ